MATQDDQRPELDAALDAVLPTLTRVSDAAAADSLRRTRIALAAGAAGAGLGGWRWAAPVVVLVAMALVAVVFWRPRPEANTPSAVVVDVRPPASRPPLPAATPRHVPPTVVPPRGVRSERLARPTRVEATSAPRVEDAPRPDPLAALVRAVQQIPEDAWSASRARAERPVVVAEAPLAPITVNPLDTPSISTLPDDPIAPGEP